MFHLLVHYQGWRDHRGELSKDRVFEYSSSGAKARVLRDGAFDLAAITQMPAVFMTELEGPGTDEVRLGRITALRDDGHKVVLDYAFDDQPRLRRIDVKDLCRDLRILDHQLWRTHWAVLEGDLFRTLYERHSVEQAPATVAQPIESSEKGNRRKVFVIHGRNLPALRQVEIFLRACGLEPLEFDQLRARMKGTPTIADIVTRGMSEAHGIIALFTPDEWSILATDLRSPKDQGDAIQRWQARPNVIFEAGMAFGRDRDRVILVRLGAPALFTDVAGIHVFDLSNSPRVRSAFRETLRGMGLAINDSTSWTEVGDFERTDVARPHALAPALPPSVSDVDARIRLRAWLNTLPQSQNLALEFSAIAQAARVSVEQVRALLPSLADGELFSWTIQEAGDETVLLSYHAY